jgi:hypothetical protein
MPRAMRLEFAGGIVAEGVRHHDCESHQDNADNKEWLVEFPPHALKVLGCP